LKVDIGWYNQGGFRFVKRGLNMEFPWGQLMAEKRAKEKESKLEDLQSKVDKAIELLQKDNPDIKLVIRTLKTAKRF